MMTQVMGGPDELRAACILSHAGLRAGVYTIQHVSVHVSVRDVVALPDGLALVPSSHHAPMPCVDVWVAIGKYAWDSDILDAIEEEHGPCTWQPSEPVQRTDTGTYPVLIGRRIADDVMVALVCSFARR